MCVFWVLVSAAAKNDNNFSAALLLSTSSSCMLGVYLVWYYRGKTRTGVDSVKPKDGPRQDLGFPISILFLLGT